MSDRSVEPLFKSLEDLRQVETCLEDILQTRAPFAWPGSPVPGAARGSVRRWCCVVANSGVPRRPHRGGGRDVHGASLLHDDVIDQTTLRRGRTR